MAKIQRELTGDYRTILHELKETVENGSRTISLEDESHFTTDSCICTVCVYERYSMLGGNRVSLSITLLKSDDKIFLSAITSGGSQAIFRKVNTLGEETFLDCIRPVVEKYRV